jgi:hypothetical protein
MVIHLIDITKKINWYNMQFSTILVKVAINMSIYPSRSTNIACFLYSPILTGRDRQIIATRFMQRLCDLDSRAISLGQSGEFTIDEICDGYLGGYNKEIVAPFVIFYFENELGYIRQLTNKKVSMTSEGRNHCREEFVLPVGL